MVTVNVVCLVVWHRNAEIEMEADCASDTQLFRYIRTVHCIERRRCVPCQVTIEVAQFADRLDLDISSESVT